MNDEIADVFGLNYARGQFVLDASPGSDEKRYSQSLLGVDGEWRGIEVRALPGETAVIENDEQGDAVSGGKGERNVSTATDDYRPVATTRWGLLTDRTGRPT